ncbi:MAG TPA: succinyldiaminopimelate transaminase, partial [Psychrobacter sp.]|nr:succinyldiaminopimelate transaminase [Psychrobacter sp.]
DVLRENLDKISHYPTTNGLFELRQTIAHWLEKRFFLNHLNPNTQVLPVMGTREAIFSIVQAVINHETESVSQTATLNQSPTPIVVMPNPFYQIYEGAAILAQATPYFIPCTSDNSF